MSNKKASKKVETVEVSNVSEMFQSPVEPEQIPASPEDLSMLLHANNLVRSSLQDLGLATRKMEALKAEIATVLEKNESELSAVSAKVTEAETAFNSLAKAMSAKYGINPNSRCSIDLNTGVFTVE
jgi:hypothetical protein